MEIPVTPLERAMSVGSPTSRPLQRQSNTAATDAVTTTQQQPATTQSNQPATTQPAEPTATRQRASARSQASTRTRANATEQALRARVDPQKPYSSSPSLAQVRAGDASIVKGNGGAPVNHVQDRLNAHGANLDADGKFGPKTQAAVKDFQRTHNLKETGRVDKDTLAALDAAPKPKENTSPNGTNGVDATQLPKTGNKFIDSIAADAVRSQKETGVPASVTMAQAILESGWGKSGLTKKGNNYFGIKGEGPAGSVTMRTREEDRNGNSYYINAKFRAYHNAQESFTDHARLFTDNKRYATAMKHTDDANRFAREIHKAGYATAHNYSDALISIMDKYNLREFDKYGR